MDIVTEMSQLIKSSENFSEMEEKLMPLYSQFFSTTVAQCLETLDKEIVKDYTRDGWEIDRLEERKLYPANLPRANQELASQEDLKQSTVQILALLTRLRQLALYPRLLFDDIEVPSSKMQATIEIVEEARSNQQPVLIFSAFTSALDLLEESFRKVGMRTLKLTGSTPKEKRKQFVETFQKGNVDVFLISLKAGGAGLHLTAASIVIHLDPWWNLSAQNQATDRAHRMGKSLS